MLVPSSVQRVSGKFTDTRCSCTERYCEVGHTHLCSFEALSIFAIFSNSVTLIISLDSLFCARLQWKRTFVCFLKLDFDHLSVNKPWIRLVTVRARVCLKTVPIIQSWDTCGVLAPGSVNVATSRCAEQTCVPANTQWQY